MKKNVKRNVLITVAVILGVVLTIVAAAFFTLNHLLNKIEKVRDHEVTDIIAPEDATDELYLEELTNTDYGLEEWDWDNSDVDWEEDDPEDPESWKDPEYYEDPEISDEPTDTETTDTVTTDSSTDVVTDLPTDSETSSTSTDFTTDLPTDFSSSSSTQKTDLPTWTNSNKYTETSEKTKYTEADLINILVVGQDDWGKFTTRQRTDTMILVSINPKNHKVSLISFQRDTYVQIPGYQDNRLNVAYRYGGFPLLKKTLQKNFDITVDGCFAINFQSFTDLINKLGGIDMELTKAEANYLNKIAKKTVYKEGVNHLDAEYALHYARCRKIDSDFARTDRQRKMILKIYETVRQSSVSELWNLANLMLTYLTSDLSNLEIMSLLTRCIPLVNDVSISSYSVPTSGMYSYQTIRGMSVVVPNLTKIKKALKTQYIPYN